MCRSAVIVVGLLVNAVCGLPAKDYVQDNNVTEILPEVSELEFKKLSESLGIPIDTLPVLSESERAIFAKLSVENKQSQRAKEANQTKEESKHELEMYKTWTERQINAQEEQYLKYRKWAEEQFDSMERKLEQIEKRKDLREEIVGDHRNGEGNGTADESRIEQRVRQNGEKEREAKEKRKRPKREYDDKIESLEDKLQKAEDKLLLQRVEQEKEKKDRERGERILLDTVEQERQQREQLKTDHARVILFKNAELNKTQESLNQAQEQLSLQKEECRMRIEEEHRRAEEELERNKMIAERENQQLRNRMSLVIESKIAELDRKQKLLSQAEQRLEQRSNKYEEEKREERQRTDQALKETKKTEQRKREQMEQEHIKATRMIEEKLEKTEQELARKRVEYEKERENWTRAENLMRENMESERRQHARLINEYTEQVRTLQGETQECIKFYQGCRRISHSQ